MYSSRNIKKVRKWNIKKVTKWNIINTLSNVKKGIKKEKK